MRVRAILGCLGLSALIVCAGCHESPSPPLGPSGEEGVSPVAYQTIGMIAEGDDVYAEQARQALADGFLSRREYDAIYDGREADRRAAVIARWRRPAPRNADIVR